MVRELPETLVGIGVVNEASTKLGIYDNPWFAVRNDFFALGTIMRLRSASWLVGGSSRVEWSLSIWWVWVVLSIRWIWIVCSSGMGIMSGGVRVVLSSRIRGRKGSWRGRKGRLCLRRSGN